MTTYTVQTWRYNGTEDIDGGDGPSECTGATMWSTADGLLYRLAQLEAIAPAAETMPILDVIHQVNNVNGGELVVLVDGVAHGIDR